MYGLTFFIVFLLGKERKRTWFHFRGAKIDRPTDRRRGLPPERAGKQAVWLRLRAAL